MPNSKKCNMFGSSCFWIKYLPLLSSIFCMLTTCMYPMLVMNVTLQYSSNDQGCIVMESKSMQWPPKGYYCYGYIRTFSSSKKYFFGGPFITLRTSDSSTHWWRNRTSLMWTPLGPPMCVRNMELFIFQGSPVEFSVGVVTRTLDFQPDMHGHVSWTLDCCM